MRYYLFTTPSAWGMGSNYDEFLVPEDSLSEIIKRELERKDRRGENYDDRMTGEWNGEVPLENATMEERIKDVIKKRTQHCSTYANKPDLIEVPEECVLKIEKKKMHNKIFRIFNQWDWSYDIIARNAEFTCYYVDFGEDYSFSKYLKRYVRFVSYQLDGVSLRDTLVDWEAVIEGRERTIKWLRKEMSQTEDASEIARIERQIRQEEITLAYLQKKPSPQSRYTEYLYPVPKNSPWKELYKDEEQWEKEKKVDYSQSIFHACPLLFQTSFEHWDVDDHVEASRYLYCEDMFQSSARLENGLAAMEYMSELDFLHGGDGEFEPEVIDVQRVFMASFAD